MSAPSAPTVPVRRSLFGCMMRRLFSPKHLYRMWKISRYPVVRRADNDPQLKLYARLLPGGFMNYGYFDNPQIDPREMSMNDIQRAQLRHGELIVDRLSPTDGPVLDVGCGMGGIVRLLQERGITPVALSPDINQIEHLRRNYPQVEAIRARFEEMPRAGQQGRFGALVTSESFQYLDLNIAIPFAAELLRPGGIWIAYDYFRIGEANERSGHLQADFEARIAQSPFTIEAVEDHTANVLPMLRYAHMWGDEVGRPLFDYLCSKIEQKRPRTYYLLQEAIELAESKIEKNLAVVDADRFAASKRYLFYVLRRR